MILVPIAHDLVQAASVNAARLVARLLDEVTEKHGAWRKRHVVDVAVQGLVHSKDELGHAAKSRLRVVRITSIAALRSPGAQLIDLPPRVRRQFSLEVVPRRHEVNEDVLVRTVPKSSSNRPAGTSNDSLSGAGSGTGSPHLEQKKH